MTGCGPSRRIAAPRGSVFEEANEVPALIALPTIC
jgi:hypothetical protein